MIHNFYKAVLISRIKKSLEREDADREVLLPIKLMLKSEICGIDAIPNTDWCPDDEKNRVIERFLRFVYFEARADNPVLLIGESCTGKDTMAQVIHALRNDGEKSFHEINCAAVPPDTLETELFGYEEGAFFGARESKAGIIELAKGGSCYINQLGKMPEYLQFKLLSMIERGKFTRFGGGDPISTADIKFILSIQSEEMGNLVSDLLYRLNPYSAIHLPTLKDRLKRNPYLIYEVFDIMADKSLVHEYPHIKAKASTMVSSLEDGSFISNVGEFRKAYDMIYREENLENRSYYISKIVFEKLRDYNGYDGNFRELENILKFAIRSAFISNRGKVLLEDFPLAVRNREVLPPEDEAELAGKPDVDIESMGLLQTLEFAEDYANEIKKEIVDSKLLKYIQGGMKLKHVLTKIEGLPENQCAKVMNKIEGIVGPIRELTKKA
jgi:transcriptional regulator with PAS, ATPase and Fis domain